MPHFVRLVVSLRAVKTLLRCRHRHPQVRLVVSLRAVKTVSEYILNFIIIVRLVVSLRAVKTQRQPCCPCADDRTTSR